jgi:hypothetical protein
MGDRLKSLAEQEQIEQDKEIIHTNFPKSYFFFPMHIEHITKRKYKIISNGVETNVNIEGKNKIHILTNFSFTGTGKTIRLQNVKSAKQLSSSKATSFVWIGFPSWIGRV